MRNPKCSGGAERIRKAYPRYRRKTLIYTDFRFSPSIYLWSRNTRAPIAGWWRTGRTVHKKYKASSDSRCPASSRRTSQSASCRIRTDCTCRFHDPSTPAFPLLCCPGRCSWSSNSSTRRFRRWIRGCTRTRRSCKIRGHRIPVRWRLNERVKN